MYDETHRQKEEIQVEYLLEFLTQSKNYCICIIDIVNSTKTVMKLSIDKTGIYYRVFLNIIARIIRKFDGIIVKNMGDGLLFYFPKTEFGDEAYFKDVFRCCLTMLNKRNEINMYMHMEGLPNISYRVSAEYGPVVIAKMSTTGDDIFGSTINICAKINSLTKPNKFVIGQGLYERTKSFPEYKFKRININLFENYNIYLVKDYLTRSLQNNN